MSSTLLTRLPYFLLCTHPFSWIQSQKGLGCCRRFALGHRPQGGHEQEGHEQEGREQEGHEQGRGVARRQQQDEGREQGRGVARRQQQDEGREQEEHEQEQGQPSAPRPAEPLKSCRHASRWSRPRRQTPAHRCGQSPDAAAPHQACSPCRRCPPFRTSPSTRGQGGGARRSQHDRSGARTRTASAPFRLRPHTRARGRGGGRCLPRQGAQSDSTREPSARSQFPRPCSRSRSRGRRAGGS